MSELPTYAESNIDCKGIPSYREANGGSLFRSEEEELAALREFAESKSYITPGTNGTLPAMDGGGYCLQSLVWGGPMDSALSPHAPSAETMQRLRALDATEKQKKADTEPNASRKRSFSQKLKNVVNGKKGSDKVVK